MLCLHSGYDGLRENYWNAENFETLMGGPQQINFENAWEGFNCKFRETYRHKKRLTHCCASLERIITISD